MKPLFPIFISSFFLIIINAHGNSHYDTICDNLRCKKERADEREERREEQEKKRYLEKRHDRAEDDPVVVTPISSASPCRHFSSTELRKIRIEERIVRGMKAKDVRKSWGKPNQVNQLDNNQEQWFYRRFRESYHLYFKDGCLDRWN